MEDVDSSAQTGRGRGRGRGGVPVLPAGLWDTLNGGAIVNDEDIQTKDSEDFNSYRFDDIGSSPSTNRRAASADTVATENHVNGRDRGKGPIRDAKGKDWDCGSCMNLNWSWRSHCNMCGTAKPSSLLADNVVRDGAGKGFNERQERRSAATVEVDEEGFDDFGRRVKGEEEDDVAMVGAAAADDAAAEDAKVARRKAKEAAALKRMNEKYRLLNPEAFSDYAVESNQSNPIGDVSKELNVRNHSPIAGRSITKNNDVGRDADTSRERGRYAGRARSRDRSRDRNQVSRDRSFDKNERSDMDRARDRSRDRGQSGRRINRGGSRDRCSNRERRDYDRSRQRERSGGRDRRRDY